MTPHFVELLSLALWSPPERDFLPEAEWIRAEAFQDASRRQAFLAGRWLIRGRLHCCCPEVNPAGFPLERTPEGKPFCPLPGLPAFNLSHTRNMVGLAVSGRGPVGLDLEDMTRSLDVRALARRWFHPEEQAFCAAEGYAPAAFFRIWTRKEALLKAEGRGLRGPWRDVNTLAAEREGLWVFTEKIPAPDVCLCAVARGPMELRWR